MKSRHFNRAKWRIEKVSTESTYLTTILWYKIARLYVYHDARCNRSKHSLLLLSETKCSTSVGKVVPGHPVFEKVNYGSYLVKIIEGSGGPRPSFWGLQEMSIGKACVLHLVKSILSQSVLQIAHDVISLFPSFLD